MTTSEQKVFGQRCDRCGELIKHDRYGNYAEEVAEIVEHPSTDETTLEQALSEPHLLVHVGCMQSTDGLA